LVVTLNVQHEDFLSIKEFASLIHVHSNTVRNMIRCGKLNAFRLGKGKKSPYRISRTEINRMTFVDLETLVKEIVQKHADAKKSL
jgi:excisionase family DNA binding protein